MNKVEILENGNVKITIPMSFRSCAGRKRIVTPDSETSFTDPMITNIARAFRWQTLIDEGKFSNVHELARAIGKDDAYVSRIIRFTLLAPDIIHAVLAGKINKSISTEKLKQALPSMWEDQKKMFDITPIQREFDVLYLFSVWEHLRYKYLSFIG